MAVGIYPTGMDNADFPTLDKYDGDWLWWKCIVYKSPGVSGALITPEEEAAFQVESKAMRKITDVGQTPFLVAQTDTSEDVDLTVTLALLVLLP